MSNPPPQTSQKQLTLCEAKAYPSTPPPKKVFLLPDVREQSFLSSFHLGRRDTSAPHSTRQCESNIFDKQFAFLNRAFDGNTGVCMPVAIRRQTHKTGDGSSAAIISIIYGAKDHLFPLLYVVSNVAYLTSLPFRKCWAVYMYCICILVFFSCPQTAQ